MIIPVFIKLKNKKFIVEIIFIFQFMIFYTQNNQNYAFTYNLIKENRILPAQYSLNNLNLKINSDSIHYLKGFLYYYKKDIDSIIIILNKIQNKDSKIYNYSRLLLALSLSYKNNYIQSIKTLNEMNETDYNFQNIFFAKNIQLAGNFLLLKDYRKYDSIIHSLKPQDIYEISTLNNFSELKNNQINFHKKSPAFSSLLSAIIPGLGKFYAGRKGEALSSFTANFIFGAMTLESYYRTKNFKNPMFIFFGLTFSVFYTGSIIGSYHTTKKQNISKQKQINNEILAQMHSVFSNNME